VEEVVQAGTEKPRFTTKAILGPATLEGSGYGLGTIGIFANGDRTGLGKAMGEDLLRDIERSDKEEGQR
jgi:hypothetical protein